MKNLKPWQAELFLFGVTFVWGATFLFTKLGINDCPPSLYVIFRFLIALTISLVFFHKQFFKIKKQQFIHGLILGLFFGIGFILQTYGLKWTTISKSAFITGIAVVLTPFVYWYVERKKISIWAKVGVVIASVGLWIFTNPKFDNINIGDVLTLLSTVLWALYITYIDVFTRQVTKFEETAQLVMMQFVSALPLLAITFMLFEYKNLHINYTYNLLISLLFNGILASFCLTWIHTSIQKFTTPVKAALIFSLEPVVATFIAFFAINEMLGLGEITGAVILMFGIAVSEFAEFIVKK